MPRTVAAVGGGVLLFDEIGSTNTMAREMVAAGRSVAVVAADRQTAGRGRLDHTWTSAPGESFTVSFVARAPRAIATDERVNGWLQMIAGLAALDAIRAAVCDANDGKLMLKWPNDLFCDGRKLGGILAEMVMSPAAFDVSADDADDDVALVFGIGINLDVPADRLPTAQATSLQLNYDLRGNAAADAADSGNAAVTDADTLRDRIAAGIAAGLRSRIAAFAADPRDQAATLLEETRQVCWTLGHEVEAHFTDGSTLRGEALALNADASLMIRTPDGKTHVVRTADVGVLA
ncbi:biotin--[acetyl-CoA-carboxylase] ligase [Bifidobacterium amazonense]|uniref:Biotin--[acetyl-CoA-carboxylase] ligase n=1 Tax=Bifidobacterium amazonense TaxID=2809027 RepID=A0ABS9VXD5_9BIFI|nr:biotin--[acetyl-CoA-carboxylase] ligase [Bifidobacterium amazonense]MCH9276752.1 biotin--[acetyl-CoA-carboxylase] ligase [Bifidobacterium amazonense]